MKQKLVLFFLCLSMCLSVSCGTKEDSAAGNPVTTNPVTSPNSDPLPEPLVTESVQDAAEDPYVGEYNDFDYNISEPALEIEKNQDGSYEIEIGIYRVSTFQNCKGTLVDDKIAFSTVFSDRLIEGTIEFDDDIATVTFTSKDWAEYSNLNIYSFEKSSDKPFDKHKKFSCETRATSNWLLSNFMLLQK